MTTVGLCFKGVQTNKEGKAYFVISPVKDITPIVIDNNKLLCLKEVEQKSDKSPKFVLDVFVPEKQEEKSEAKIPY